ncbi:MAG TPA: hypothetical protein VNF04_13610 [Stellaceae bacterium]|nr:hypothetical protein [Stellaceae bacterium]
MSRLGSLFWLILVMGSGFAMYMVKYGVQNVEGELAQVRRQTVAAQLDIRVLDAEWNYLTQPERLAALNQKFLQLGPIKPKQLETTIAEIPLRPAPAPAPAAPPAEMVAEAPQAPVGPKLPGSGLPVTPAALVTAPYTAPQTRTPMRTTATRATGTLDQLFAQIAGGN